MNRAPHESPRASRPGQGSGHGHGHGTGIRFRARVLGVALLLLVPALHAQQPPGDPSTGSGQAPGWGPIPTAVEPGLTPRDLVTVETGSDRHIGVLEEMVIEGRTYDQAACAWATEKFPDGETARYVTAALAAPLLRLVARRSDEDHVRVFYREGSLRGNVSPMLKGGRITAVHLPRTWLNIFDGLLAPYAGPRVRERAGALADLRAQYAAAIAQLSERPNHRQVFDRWLSDHYWRLIEDAPDNVTGYLVAADEALARGGLDEAFGLYQSARRAHAARPVTGIDAVERRLGDYYARAEPGRPARAAAHYRAAGPDPDTRLRLARLLAASGERTAARNLLVGLQGEPGVGPEARLELGVLLLRLGDLTRAREALRVQDDPRAVVALAEADAAEGAYPAAEQRLRALPLIAEVLTQVASDEQQRRRARARARQSGEPEGPADEAPPAPVPYDPLIARALRLLGLCVGLAAAPGRPPPEADLLLALAQRYDPMAADRALVFAARLAEHHATGGDHQAARAAYNAALAVNPRSVPALTRLARLHERMPADGAWFAREADAWEADFEADRREALRADFAAGTGRSALARALLGEPDADGRWSLRPEWNFRAVALLLYRRALECDVNALEALNALGVMAYQEAAFWTGAFRRELLDEAERYFARSVSDYGTPDQPEIWEFRGLLALERYQLEALVGEAGDGGRRAAVLLSQARRAFEEAEKQGSVIAQNGLAFVYYAAGQSELAKAKLRAVLARAPAGADADYARHWLAALERNESRMQWRDDFTREPGFTGEFGKKWDAAGTRESGLKVRREAGAGGRAAVALEGVAGAAGTETRFYRVEAADTLLGAEFALRLERYDDAEVGIFVAQRSTRGQQESAVLRFGVQTAEGRARFVRALGAARGPKVEPLDLEALATDQVRTLRFMIDFDAPGPGRFDATLRLGIDGTVPIGPPFAAGGLNPGGADREFTVGVYVIPRVPGAAVRVLVEEARIVQKPARKGTP